MEDYDDGYNSNLQSLFGVRKQDGNQSLQYVPPKQPRANAPAEKTPEKRSSVTSGATQLIHATTIHAFKFDSASRSFQQQGMLGCAILSAGASNGPFNLVVYDGQKQQKLVTNITTDWSFTVQANNYASFSEEGGQLWSILFKTSDDVYDFCKHLALVKSACNPNMSALTLQDIEAGNAKGQAVAEGDTVAVRYSGWLRPTSLTVGSLFDSNSGQENDRFKFKIGEGKVIQGWERGVVGMRKGGKRFLIVPPALGYGEAGSPPKIPPRSTLLFEVEVLNVKYGEKTVANETVEEEPNMSGPPTPTRSSASGEDEAEAERSRLLKRVANMSTKYHPALPAVTQSLAASSLSSNTNANTESQSSGPSQQFNQQQGSHTNQGFNSNMNQQPNQFNQQNANMGSQAFGNHPTMGQFQQVPQHQHQQQQQHMTAYPGALALPSSVNPQQYNPYQQQAGMPTQTPYGPSFFPAPPNSYGQLPALNAFNLPQHTHMQPPTPAVANPQVQEALNLLYGLPATTSKATDSVELGLIMATKKQQGELQTSVKTIQERLDELNDKMDKMYLQNQRRAVDQKGSMAMYTQDPNNMPSGPLLLQSLQRVLDDTDRWKMECENKSDRIHSLSEKVSALQKEKEKLIEESHRYLEERSGAVQATTEQQRKQYLELQQEKMKVEMELNSTVMALSEANRKSVYLQKSNDDLSSTVELTQAALDKAQKEIQALYLEREATRRQIQQFQADLDHVQDLKQNTERELANTVRQLQEQTASRYEAESALAALQSSIPAMDQERNNERLNFQQQIADRDALLRNKEIQFNAEIKALQAQHKQAMDDLTQKLNSVTEESHERGMREGTDKAEAVAAAKYAELNRQISELTAELAELEEEKSDIVSMSKEKMIQIRDDSRQKTAETLKLVMNRVFYVLRNRVKDENPYMGKTFMDAVKDVVKQTTINVVSKVAKGEDIPEDDEDEEFTELPVNQPAPKARQIDEQTNTDAVNRKSFSTNTDAVNRKSFSANTESVNRKSFSTNTDSQHDAETEAVTTQPAHELTSDAAVEPAEQPVSIDEENQQTMLSEQPVDASIHADSTHYEPTPIESDPFDESPSQEEEYAYGSERRDTQYSYTSNNHDYSTHETNEHNEDELRAESYASYRTGSDGMDYGSHGIDEDPYRYDSHRRDTNQSTASFGYPTDSNHVESHYTEHESENEYHRDDAYHDANEDTHDLRSSQDQEAVQEANQEPLPPSQDVESETVFDPLLGGFVTRVKAVPKFSDADTLRLDTPDTSTSSGVVSIQEPSHPPASDASEPVAAIAVQPVARSVSPLFVTPDEEDEEEAPISTAPTVAREVSLFGDAASAAKPEKEKKKAVGLFGDDLDGDSDLFGGSTVAAKPKRVEQSKSKSALFDDDDEDSSSFVVPKAKAKPAPAGKLFDDEDVNDEPNFPTSSGAAGRLF
eukprot:GILJ01003860.1.p1 GENE.GILJ01003860.1~~GILJ01003860.1.p1  ORF type:complete len:1440 (+),score=373.27 GILJ01003860.1:48-4367(+)